MLYIHHLKGYSEIVYKDYERIVDKSNITIIKKLCKAHLFNYDYRIKYTKEIFNIRTRIPIYISENLIFIPTKSPRNYDNVWVNYANINHISKINGKTKVVFNNLKEIMVDISYDSLLKNINHVKRIIDHMNHIKAFIDDSLYRM
ncbi:MAG: competence protein ComK [Acholeplasmataceae bacterium]